MAGTKRLTAREVKTLKADKTLSDGDGLYLRGRTDKRTGRFGATWFFKTKIGNKRPEVGLGSRDTVTLARAREKAQLCREAVDRGEHPSSAFRKPGEIPDFAEAAREFMDKVKLPELTSDKSAAKWERALFKHSAGLASRPVDQITTDDVLAILEPDWLERNHTLRFTRGAIAAVLGYAKTRKWRSGDNPAAWEDNLKFMLSKAKPDVEHYASMSYADVPAFFVRLLDEMMGEYGGGSPRCLAFQILSVKRSGEVRVAEWSQFDYEERVWNVPRQQTKKKVVAYRVPLTDAMLEVLGPHGGTGLVFPGAKAGEPYSDNTLRLRMRKMAKKHARAHPDAEPLPEGWATPHGFRTSFKTFAQEKCPEAPDDDSEMVMGHIVGSESRNAYARSDKLEARKRLLNRWNDHVVSALPPASHP